MTGKALKDRGTVIQLIGVAALLGIPRLLGGPIGFGIAFIVFVICLVKGGSLHKQGRMILEEEKESQENARVLLKVPPRG